jgi:hypothetical protein
MQITYLFINYTLLFFTWWRAPQQMLRTHHSLKAYCTTLWWRWAVFLPSFTTNGAPVEWNRQGKTDNSGEKPVPVPLCPPQTPHGLTRDRTRASAVEGRRLTAWAMARPFITDNVCCVPLTPFPWKQSFHVFTHVAALCSKIRQLTNKYVTYFTVFTKHNRVNRKKEWWRYINVFPLNFNETFTLTEHKGSVSNRYCQVTNNDILCFTITYLTSNFVKHSWCSRLTIMIEKASYFNITYIMVLY